MMKFTKNSMKDINDFTYAFDEVIKRCFGFLNVGPIAITMDNYDYKITWKIVNFEWISEISISIEEDFYVRFKIDNNQIEYDELKKMIENEQNLVKRMIYADLKDVLETSFRCS